MELLSQSYIQKTEVGADMVTVTPRNGPLKAPRPGRGWIFFYE